MIKIHLTAQLVILNCFVLFSLLHIYYICFAVKHKILCSKVLKDFSRILFFIFYFNFAVSTPYSHGVRRQQTDRMFPCKEKIYLSQKGECVMKKTSFLKKLTAMAATLAMTCFIPN